MEEEVVKTEETDVAIQSTQAVSTGVANINLPLGWMYKGSTAAANVQKARVSTNQTFGMYTGVPIVCRGQACPFKATCWIPDNELEVGGRCPIEVGAILDRYEKYAKELKIMDDDTVDHSLLKDVIDIEILMLRADNALALSGDFIEEIVAGVDDKGNIQTRPELHKAFEAKQRLRQDRIKILNQLNSTRKDKRQEVGGLTDPSSIASSLMQKMRALQEEGKIIDVTPQEVISND